jgi:uncharacterized DUF497 family protein
MRFEWDNSKEADNVAKHGVSFAEAKEAFDDADHIILPDKLHSSTEQCYFCIGRVERGVLTVRFTLRNTRIRIIGAGFWRKGKQYYERQS